MAVTAFASGTDSSVSIGTENFHNVNEAGVFIYIVDLNEMAAGDVTELRAYVMTLTSGTARVAYYARFEGAQPTDNKIAISAPLSNELTDSQALRFSLKQTEGTGRSYPWKILKHA